MITSPDRLKVPGRRRQGLLVIPAVAADLAALAACSSSGSSSSALPTSSATGSSAAVGSSSPSGAAQATAEGLKSATIGGVTVLTNAKGFTLYSFAPDTATKSA
jgi:predicted lipoprotein with Yx(FWY)xxD motif